MDEMPLNPCDDDEDGAEEGAADFHAELMSRVMRLSNVCCSRESGKQALRVPLSSKDANIEARLDEILEILQSIADTAQYLALYHRPNPAKHRKIDYNEAEVGLIIELSLNLIVCAGSISSAKLDMIHKLSSNALKMLSLVHDHATDKQMKFIFDKLIEPVRASADNVDFNNRLLAHLVFCITYSRVDKILTEDEAFVLILEFIPIAAKSLDRITPETDPTSAITFTAPATFNSLGVLSWLSQGNPLSDSQMLLNFLHVLQRHAGTCRFKEYAYSRLMDAKNGSDFSEASVLISVLAIQFHRPFWKAYETQDETEELIKWVVQHMDKFHGFSRTLALHIICELTFRKNTQYGGFILCIEYDLGSETAKKFLQDLNSNKDNVTATNIMTKYLSFLKDPQN